MLSAIHGGGAKRLWIHIRSATADKCLWIHIRRGGHSLVSCSRYAETL